MATYESYGKGLQQIDTMTARAKANKIDINVLRDDYKQQLDKLLNNGFKQEYINNLGGDKYRIFSKHIDDMHSLLEYQLKQIADIRAQVVILQQGATRG